MLRKYSHQLITGISFGLTTAVITSLGMIIGIQAATSSKPAVLAAIIIMAIADGLSDAVSLHTAEEAETEDGRHRHNQKEVWITTLLAFLSVCAFTLSFAVPILVLPLQMAIWPCIAWGMSLLILLNFYVAKTSGANPARLICEHVLLAIFVILLSHLTGNIIATVLK